MRPEGVFLLLLLLLEDSLSTYVPCLPCECYLRGGEVYARCSGRHLKDVPDTIPRSVNHMLINENHIHVENYTFQRFKDLISLNLSSNRITVLGVDAFVHNKKLKTLNLNNNMLKYESFPKGVFRYQKALISLDIANNKMSEYPDSALSDLASLSSLVVDGLPIAVFRRGFANLKVRNLRMSGNSGRCQTTHLTNKTFIYLEHLFYLDVSKCNILKIDAGAFLPLRRIDTIDLSDNKYLGYDVLGQSLFGLRNSSIRTLKANRIVSEYSIGQILKKHHVKYFPDTNITEFSFDFNRLEIVESNIINYFSKLETVSIKGNRFVFGPYLFEGDRFTNLKVLQASNQYDSSAIGMFRRYVFNTMKTGSMLAKRYGRENIPGSRAQFSHFESDLQPKYHTGEQRNSQELQTSEFVKGDKNELKHVNFRKNIRVPLPKHLHIINISNSNLEYTIPLIVIYNNTLRAIDASGNLFTKWIGPITSVTGHLQLEYFDLSNNFCKTINSTFFNSTTHLRTLNISNNYLSEDLSKDVDGLIFKQLKRLRTLRISHNILQDLPQALFSHLSLLEHLDLSWNSLSSWTVAIGHMVHLQHLDISSNRFLEIPQSLRAEIDNITKKQHSLRISIKGNSLRCDCKTLNSLQWMLDSKVTFPELNVTKCVQEDMSSVHLGDLQELVRKLQLQCGTTASLVVGLSLGVFICLLLSVAGVLYRYRWKLRYLYNTTRRRHRGYQRLNQEQDNFTYDAFISYSDEDRSFVIEDMQLILEERFGLKLCIHHRDFMVGQAITDNIINAIQTSRRTVVVLSPSFVKSSWCLYEVHMARLEGVYTGRDVMCVVWYKDPPSTRDLSSDLLEELATGTYLKYNGEEQEMFWQSLRDALAGTRD